MAGIIVPVLIHFCVINMLQIMRLHFDAASLTAMAAVFTLPIFIFMMQRDQRAGYLYRKQNRMLTGREAAEISALALICNLFMTLILTQLQKILGLSNEVSQTLLQGSALSVIVGVGVIVPVAEEVLFRGLVYQRLRDYNKKHTAMVLAAAVFAIYHGNVMQILFAFPMGIIILTVYEKYDTLLAAILFHIVVNSSSIMITALM